MNKRGPWRVTQRRSVYKNPWVELTEDIVIHQSGVKSVYSIFHINPGVTVLALDNAKNVYLSKNFQYALNEEHILSTAGGGIEEGEEPIACAKRELKEESGISAKKWTPLGSAHAIGSSLIDSPTFLYLAQDLTMGKQMLEKTESISIFKIPLKDAVEWVMMGKITQASSALLILKAHEYLKKN